MKSTHTRTALAAGALLVTGALLLTSCAGSQNGGAGASGSVLVIDHSFTAQSIDPATIFQVTDAMVATGIYQTLLSYEGSATEPSAELAKSWTVSPDGRATTFNLDERAKFADGSPVTADDVLFSFERLRNLKASPSYLMDGLTVTAPDEKTVVVSSETPAPYIPSLVTSTAAAIVDADKVRAAGGSDADDAATADKAGKLFTSTQNGIGSGPYQLQQYDTNSQITLVKNENWWMGDVPFERIVIRNVKSAQQQRSSIESGESRIALDIPGRIAKDIDETRLTVTQSASPEVLYLGMSMDPASPTSKPAVREAIQLGIDYQALVGLAGPGAKRAAGIIPQHLTGSIPVDEAISTDVTKAKALVEQAGASGATITFDYANDYTRLAGVDYNIIAQAIQAQLKAIGLNVELNPTPTSTSLQRYGDGQTQMALWSWPPDYADPDNLLVFSPGALIGERVHWAAGAAPDVVALNDAARAAVGDQREPAYLAWNKAVAAKGPYAYLFEPSFTLVAAKNVSAERDVMASLNLADVKANPEGTP